MKKPIKNIQNGETVKPALESISQRLVYARRTNTPTNIEPIKTTADKPKNIEPNTVNKSSPVAR